MSLFGFDPTCFLPTKRRCAGTVYFSGANVPQRAVVSQHAVLHAANEPAGRADADQFINYSLRWGSESEWERYTVSARGARWHSWSWDSSHAHEFPTPYICFDATFSDDQPEKEYALETNVALATGPDSLATGSDRFLRDDENKRFDICATAWHTRLVFAGSALWLAAYTLAIVIGLSVDRM